MKILKIAIPVLFGLAAVVAVVIFSFGDKGGSGSVNDTPVIMWGTLPEYSMNTILGNLRNTDEITVEYVQVDRNVFQTRLISALANGVGPDVLILPHDLLLIEKNKFFPLSYEIFPVESFTSTFARAGEIFLQEEGVYGLPFAIDPIVMYWNRDIFINEGIAQPPRFWREFFSLALKLTKVDVDGDLTQSFVAMGTVGNIEHSKEILSAMIMQTGQDIVRLGSVGLESTFGSSEGLSSVLGFYTEFSNTRRPSYSWNASLPNSIESFAAGDLAIYFGLASDNAYISQLNPHLDYGVASFPQIENSNTISTFGDVYAFVFLKNSPNLQSAYDTAYALALGDYPSTLPASVGIAPARIDLLGIQQNDNFFPVVYDSAIKTRVWLDPEPNETRRIFDKMINTITVERESVSTASEEGRSLMTELIRRLK